MAKAKNSLVKTNKIGPIMRSKRTMKKSGGDDFDSNVRSTGLKLKKKKMNKLGENKN